MTDLRKWNSTVKEQRSGEKPRCDVKPWPAEFAKELMTACVAAFPEINARPLGLALQKIMGTVKSGGGVRSAFPRWMQILADELGPPSFAYPLPIPLCNARCKLLLPEAEGSDYRAEFHIDRIERDGRTATSTCDTVTLRTKYRTRALIEKLLSGEYHRNGASLQYDDRRNKWFVNLGYRMPIVRQASLDAALQLVVRAGEVSPLVIAVNGRDIPVGGKGENVAYKRAMIDRERQSRNANYRWSPGAAKGHGRERAQGERMIDFVNQWARFCKSGNYELAACVVSLAIEHRCGRVQFNQPTAATEGTTLLAMAGKTEQTRIASGWPWHRLAQIIQQSCNKVGIKTSVFKEEKLPEEETTLKVVTDGVV